MKRIDQLSGSNDLGVDVIAALIVSTCCVAFAAANTNSESPKPLPAGISPQMIVMGQKIFHGRGECFRCHGKGGGGTFVAPPLNDEIHIHLNTASYDEILARIRLGVPNPKHHFVAMPPLGGAPLNNDEVQAVAAYVFSIDRGQDPNRKR